jgi:ribonuclease BN (tRNA processing enzyme)
VWRRYARCWWHLTLHMVFLHHVTTGHFVDLTPLGIFFNLLKKNHFWKDSSIYIKELLVQKYWQLISTKQLWSVRNIVSSKSRTVQYRVPGSPGLYRNVQVPRCLGFTATKLKILMTYLFECLLECYKSEYIMVKSHICFGRMVYCFCLFSE